MKEDRDVVDQRVVFRLTEGRVELDVRDLESINQTLLAFLREPDQQFRAVYGDFQGALVEELEISRARLDGDGSLRVGRWVLQERDGILTLTRYPPRGDTTYVFFARLVRKGGGWAVAHFGHERMVGR